MTQWILQMAVNLALTILVEGLVMAILFRKGRFVYYSVLVNLLTNPALNLVLLLVAQVGSAALYAVGLAALEVGAVLVEAAVYKKLCGWRMQKALAVAFVLNTLSFGVGMLVKLFLR